MTNLRGNNRRETEETELLLRIEKSIISRNLTVGER